MKSEIKNLVKYIAKKVQKEHIFGPTEISYGVYPYFN